MNRAVLVIAIALLFSACTQNLTETNNKLSTDIPPSAPSKSTVANLDSIPAGWETYSNADLGLYFRYPPEYTTQIAATNNPLSFLSPLDPKRNKKETSVNENELKIEIYYTNSDNKTIERLAQERETQASQSGSTIELREWRTIDNQKVYYTKGRGYGTFENYIFTSKDKGITIAKYPTQTTRQSEFDKILSSIKINK